VFKLYFGNNILALVLLPLIIGLYYTNNFLFGDQVIEAGLSFGFWGKTSGQGFFIYELSALLVVFVNAILINMIFNRNDFMEKNNFIISLLYVVCYSFFHSFYFLDGLSVAHCFLVLMLYQLFALRQNKDARRTAFNAAILFSLGCTFYPVLILVTPFLFWIIWIFRPIIAREASLIIVGLMLPLVYAALYGYLFDIEITLDEFSSSFAETVSLEMAVVGLLVLALFLFAIPVIINKINTSAIRLKKLFKMQLLLFCMFLAIGVLEGIFYEKRGGASLLIIPTIFFITYAFGKKNMRVVPVAVFYLFFLFSIGKFFVPIQL
jgi:hypothetical protein